MLSRTTAALASTVLCMLVFGVPGQSRRRSITTSIERTMSTSRMVIPPEHGGGVT
jgi:hypothetical protein